MKKKILAGVMLATMIFSLTACGSGEGSTTKGSKQTSVDVSENNNKDILTEAGWKAHTELGLGFYLPDIEDIKVKYSDDKQDKNKALFYVGYNDEYGLGILGIQTYKLDSNTKTTVDSIGFIISNITSAYKYASEVELVLENDFYYLYQYKVTATRYGNLPANEYKTEAYRLILLPKDCDFYYILGIDYDSFADFDTTTDFYEGKVYKEGDLFTENTYEAFKNTIQYLGK